MGSLTATSFTYTIVMIINIEHIAVPEGLSCFRRVACDRQKPNTAHLTSLKQRLSDWIGTGKPFLLQQRTYLYQKLLSPTTISTLAGLRTVFWRQLSTDEVNKDF